MKIRWWPHTLDPRVASYRLRCVHVIEQLRLLGVDAGVLARGEVPHVLVLSKRYDPRSLEQAVNMRARSGTRLVLDICDNHFYAQSDESVWRVRAENLRHAVRSVDLLVASTPALADVAMNEVNHAGRAVVIGDASEIPTAYSRMSMTAHPYAHLRLATLRQSLHRASIPEGRRLVWFGHHGSGNADSGMDALGKIRQLLECEAREAPLSLTVISNNRSKFEAVAAPWRLATFYLPWHRATFSLAMHLHDIAVIPIHRNPFTDCKTNNRVTSAVLHGLAVAADSIPSYAPFAECAVLDDWDRGLRTLMEDVSLRNRQVERGREIIAAEWTLTRIAGLWRDALVAI